MTSAHSTTRPPASPRAEDVYKTRSPSARPAPTALSLPTTSSLPLTTRTRDSNVTNIMDRSSSVVAAFHAGKLPSQKQVSQGIDRLLSSPFLNNEPSTGVGELSAQGRQLQDDVRSLLNAYKKLGEDKNGGSINARPRWNSH